MLEPAGRLLALALKLDPNNLAAQVNLAANEHLRRGQPIPASVRKPIEAYTPGIVELFGPVDEPRHLEALGDAALTLDEPLVRTAANAFVRARELDPASLDAAIGYARTCVAANEPKLAFEAVAKAAALAAGGKPTKGQSSHLARAEANAHLRDGNLPKAQQVVLNALERLPDDLPLLDLMTFLNVQAGTPAQALPFIERVAKLKPNDDAVLQRKGHILLQAGQYDAAVAVLDSVLSRQFDDKASRMNRGTAHLLAGRPAKAAEDFQTVLRRVPTAVDAMIGLAEASIARKDKPSALRHLDAAIALLEPNAPLRSNLLARVASVRAAP
jgi:tetratricopeptide (TPR) repeat protein